MGGCCTTTISPGSGRSGTPKETTGERRRASASRCAVVSTLMSLTLKLRVTAARWAKSKPSPGTGNAPNEKGANENGARSLMTTRRLPDWLTVVLNGDERTMRTLAGDAAEKVVTFRPRDWACAPAHSATAHAAPRTKWRRLFIPAAAPILQMLGSNPPLHYILRFWAVLCTFIPGDRGPGRIHAFLPQGPDTGTVSRVSLGRAFRGGWTRLRLVCASPAGPGCVITFALCQGL